MEHSTLEDRISTTPVRYALGFALLWAVLAAVRPGTTFHVAPVLVAGAAPLVYRFQGGTSRWEAIRLALVGMALAASTTVVLAILGLLGGPTLLPFGDGFVESLAGVAVGGVFGFAVAVWPHRSDPA